MVGMASQSVSGFTSPVSTTRNDDLRKKIIQDNSLDFSSASQHIEDTPSTVTPGDQTCQKIVSVNQIDIWENTHWQNFKSIHFCITFQSQPECIGPDETKPPTHRYDQPGAKVSKPLVFSKDDAKLYLHHNDQKTLYWPIKHQ